jgi:transcriptional regulator with XRE-family HTH domain
MEIGVRIKKIRTQQKRTLQEIADASGFTKSLLSKIENGVVIPPVATLTKIAKALGVKVSTLVEQEQNGDKIFTPSVEIRPDKLTQTEKGYSIYPFASEHVNKKMQPFLFCGTKGEVLEHTLSHEGEEFIYMLEGEMKFKVGNIEYILKPGDSLYFNSVEGHGVIPLSDEIKYLDIFVE